MFKHMKLSTKIGVGFGILVVISAVLGLVGWRGLTTVACMTELNRGGNDCLDLLNQCGSLRREFTIRGFEKYGETNKDASENWEAAFDKVMTCLQELNASKRLPGADRATLTEAIDKMPAYRASFGRQKEARTMKDAAFAAWRQTGSEVAKEIAGIMTNVIEPGRKAAQLSKDVNEIAKWDRVSSNLHEMVAQDFLTLRIGATYLVVTDKEEQWTAYLAQLKKVESSVDAWAGLVKGNENLEAAAHRMAAALKSYETSGLQYHSGMETQRSADTEMAASAKVLLTLVNHLQDSLEARVQSTAAWTNGLMIGMAATGIVVGVVLAVLITLSIVKPIKRIITGLTDGAEQVASASGQVSAASQSLAEGATEQAAGLQETSSSLEEMSAMTKQNADNAQQANTLASEAKRAADTGSESMNRMNAAIQEIQRSSDETSKIIKVIDEIAFQTNLLALNAAVEAARAGEAGKGFAVVAEEVRNLAMRSAEAAKNTSNMIEDSVKNAKNGVDIATEVGKVLHEIVQSVGKTTDLISEIAAASQEQAQGIDQVNTAVSQMDKVTQQNAANAEESASASEELSSQAESMNQIVGELVALVGGNARKASTEAPRTTAASASHPETHNIPQGLARKNKKGSKLGTSDKVFHEIADPSARRSIPLNDTDLGEFNE
jgi:methyl-accepting chemotaxis protein